MQDGPTSATCGIFPELATLSTKSPLGRPALAKMESPSPQDFVTRCRETKCQSEHICEVEKPERAMHRLTNEKGGIVCIQV